MPNLIIPPRDLPNADAVFPTDSLVVDNGSTVSKATPVQIVAAGLPAATLEEAEAGVLSGKYMSPLTTAAAIAALYGEPDVDSLNDLRSNSAFTLTPGQPGTVSVGQIVRTRREGAALEVLEAGSSGADLVSAGGVRFRLWRDAELGTIVFAGSSTFEGFGAGTLVPPSAGNGWASMPNSFVGLVAAKIGGRARVINRSVGGRNTLSVIGAFVTEIAPWRPRFVVLGTGWTNEDGATDYERAANYLSRVAYLNGMCQSIGATLIVAAFNPVNNLTAGLRRAQYDVKRGLADLGIRVWDFAGGAATDDLTFMSGLNTDDVHANVAGHAVYAEQAQIADFYASGAPRGPRDQKNCFAIKQTDGTADIDACLSVRILPEDHPLSWSILAEIRNDDAADVGGRFLTAGLSSGQEIQLRKTGNGASVVLSLGGTTILSGAMNPAANNMPHQYLICYRARDGRISWYHDGVLVGTATAGLAADARLARVDFGGAIGTGLPAVGYACSDLRVWGTDFKADGRAGRIFSFGERPIENLLADVDMTQRYNAGVGNAAGIRGRIYRRLTGDWIDRWKGSNANGSWTIDPDAGEATCYHSLNLGSPIAFGAGTLADPYRTGPVNWTLPLRFNAPPQHVDITTRPSGAPGGSQPYMLSGISRAWSNAAINDIQAVKLSSNNDATSVVARVKAVGL